ncbi:MAG: aspartyl-phosphate phosphatase Spo0E family protein, partial [Bacilli bacterium]
MICLKVIEKKRQRIYDMMRNHSLSSSEIVELSQELDDLLNVIEHNSRAIS